VLASIVTIGLPDWIAEIIDDERRSLSDDERMSFVIRLARENVERGTGGPFGAAVFERESGKLVGVGVNSVVRLNNPTAHAEMVALQLAAYRRGNFSLGGPPAHDLFTSCDPCAMCLGAVLWSGIERVVCAATRDDALELGFDEGPVFAESWRYLVDRGVEVTHGVRREEAKAVLKAYAGKGPIYNG
jgi:tRNA(Arg) A34 adenosine deaminase TadA